MANIINLLNFIKEKRPKYKVPLQAKIYLIPGFAEKHLEEILAKPVSDTKTLVTLVDKVPRKKIEFMVDRIFQTHPGILDKNLLFSILHNGDYEWSAKIVDKVISNGIENFHPELVGTLMTWQIDSKEKSKTLWKLFNFIAEGGKLNEAYCLELLYKSEDEDFFNLSTEIIRRRGDQLTHKEVNQILYKITTKVDNDSIKKILQMIFDAKNGNLNDPSVKLMMRLMPKDWRREMFGVD